MVLLGVVVHFVSSDLTDVGGIGIDFDLTSRISPALLQHSRRRSCVAAAAAMAPLKAAAPRPRPRPEDCRVGVVDVAAPLVGLVRVPAILFLL